jgi:hypothetical protein
MKQLMKYGGWIVGLLLLVGMIFPHLFLPAGIGCATLGIFTATCQKNVSGASVIYISDKTLATAFTISTTPFEITAITGTTPFYRVDTIQDSVEWNEEGARVGLNNWAIKNTINFDIMPPNKTTNIFLQSLLDDSPCGIYAIVLDGNGQAWVVGVNTVDGTNRPLRLGKQSHKTGKGLQVAEGNIIQISLDNECSGLAIPLNATLTAMVVAGAGSILKTS